MKDVLFDYVENVWFDDGESVWMMCIQLGDFFADVDFLDYTWDDDLRFVASF